jgi:hypothetical protein
VAFLDDDDLWAPWHLATLLHAARTSGAAFVFSGQITTDERRRYVRHSCPGPERLLECLMQTNVVGSPSGVMAETSLLRHTGGFDARFSVLADWDLWLRLATVARAAGTGALTVAYMEHPHGMSQDADEVVREWRLLTDRHSSLRSRVGIDFGTAYLWRWFGDRYGSAGRRGQAARWYLRAAAEGGGAKDAADAVGMLLGIHGRTRDRSGGPGVVPPDAAWLQLHAPAPHR